VRTWLVAGVLLAVGAACLGCAASSDTCSGPADAGCTRVLFVGNSYTAANDLPTVFVQLAAAGGQRVQSGVVANGGATLADEVADPAVSGAITASAWRFVVLQEQSEIPSVPQLRTAEMFPAARTLAARIAATGATPLFFMTWAHEGGLPDDGLPDYDTMQTQIDQGYVTIATELRVPVAPVGYAWSLVRRADPGLDLWQGDGSHPTTAGTYLAACVFYATIFSRSPVGLTYQAGLSTTDAQVLQAQAMAAVFLDRQHWDSP